MQKRADRGRDLNPDDKKARMEFAARMRTIRMSTGMPLRSIRKANGLDMLAREKGLDWKFSSIQVWTGYFNFEFFVVFEGFEHVEGFDPVARGEGSELAKCVRRKVKELRMALGFSGMDMNRALGQKKTYLVWERRGDDDVQLSMAQRVVRVLGGQLKLNLEHKYNSGINKRIGTRDGT